MKRVALFCDIPGLWWSSTKYGKGKVNYAKLLNTVGAGRQVLAAQAWLADREGLDKFERALQHNGYSTIVVGRQVAIDQLITAAALEAVEHTSIDVVAIAASSGQYQTLKDRLKPIGKSLEIWAFPVACSLDAMQSKADRWCVLNEHITMTAA